MFEKNRALKLCRWISFVKSWPLGQLFLLAPVFAFVGPVRAQTTSAIDSCAEMEVFDVPTAMCMPLAMPGMPMQMLMIHGNAFVVGDAEEGRRGRNALAAPNMLMFDLGRSFFEHHYVNLEYMGTAERWTYPDAGDPLMLQIGEENRNHVPYLDAQHPHSSPVMGLTLSDTISLGQGKDHIKVFFAPRGEASDGPIAFMHRATAVLNPDAPLGHHIGQDVGHISSTVIGASLHLAGSGLELSTYNGQEPEPQEVDLPLRRPNSFSARFSQHINPHLLAMASMAYVKQPEATEPELDHIWRYSASLYSDRDVGQDLKVHQTLIYGLIRFYDQAAALNSFAYEFALVQKADSIWGRLEVLQRTANELEITSVGQPDQGRWVEAGTIGYTRTLVSWQSVDLAAGLSVTRDFLPALYRPAYGGEPLSGRVFLQASGMKMLDL